MRRGGIENEPRALLPCLEGDPAFRGGKELQEMELNGLVHRKVCETKPVTVEYSLTPYSETLKEVLEALNKWGMQHRERMMSTTA